jgi:alanine racemase
MRLLVKNNKEELKFTTSDIARITGGDLTGDPDLVISEIITDSRHFSVNDGLAFIAIKGQNHDGHMFIDPLYKRGIRSFIVEKIPVDAGNYEGSAFILTENTVDALQLLAAEIRKSFRSPVIAVTGSTGKTIVKEWLADILGLSAPVLRSPKSFNSQIGVPLSVLKLNDKYKIGIFEAGISRMNEMDKLRKVINPDIGVITNIGDAHSENFPDQATKAREKLKLFTNSSLIVYCSDHDMIRRLIDEDQDLQSKMLIDWSLHNKEATVSVKITNQSEGNTSVKVSFREKDLELLIPFDDRASVENAITVLTVCLALQIDTGIISKGLASLVSVAMRMEMKSGINGCRLIEDYYNSDPGSLGMAIDYLKTRRSNKATLILSDFIQTGRESRELYGEVSDLVKRSGVERFIGIGPDLTANSDLFSGDSKFYKSTDEFVLNFTQQGFRNETILLKGARKFEFEKISKLLERQVHQTMLEINLDAIAHNLNEFRRFLRPETRIMVMVKAFAYGAGPSMIAELLEYQRISYLGVAYADEGADLRNSGVTMPVMVMNPDYNSSEQIIRYNLEPVIYSFPSLERFSGVASKHGLLQYPVHIEIDTGLHRLGFLPEETDELGEKLARLESIKVTSVFSHFASSEDENHDDFTHRQAGEFIKAVSRIRVATGYPFLRHICNSAAIVRFPQYHFDMVRPGIGIYGTGDLPGLDLKPAGRFKTRISQIKKIGAGEPVGYGCADISDQERTIAILPAGYADGLNRMLGNRNGSLLIRNRRVPIIGNICMDMCMADITGLDASVDDEAEIFGENINISEIASICHTIPYEILTSIPQRVKRVFYRE